MKEIEVKISSLGIHVISSSLNTILEVFDRYEREGIVENISAHEVTKKEIVKLIEQFSELAKIEESPMILW